MFEEGFREGPLFGPPMMPRGTSLSRFIVSLIVVKIPATSKAFQQNFLTTQLDVQLASLGFMWDPRETTLPNFIMAYSTSITLINTLNTYRP